MTICVTAAGSTRVKTVAQVAVVDDALRTRNDESTGTMESVGLTQLVTRNVQRLSEKMRGLDPLNPELIRKWVKYWIAAGF